MITEIRQCAVGVLLVLTLASCHSQSVSTPLDRQREPVVSSATWRAKHIIQIPNSGLAEICFSPDQKKLLVGSFRKGATLFDVALGRRILTVGGEIGSLRFPAFSSDGKRFIVSNCVNGSYVFDAARGTQLLRLQGVQTRFSKDSRWILGFRALGNGVGQSSAQTIWDAQTGKGISFFPSWQHVPREAGDSPQTLQSHLVYLPSGDATSTATIYDKRTRSVIARISSREWDADFRGTEHLRVFFTADSIVVSNTVTGTTCLTLDDKSVTRLVVSPDEEWCATLRHPSSESASDIFLHNLQQTSRRVTLRGHAAGVREVVWGLSSDVLASVDFGDSLILWNRQPTVDKQRSR